MWAFGRYDLRLSEEEFWALTPREFVLLADRARAEVRWRDYRAAVGPWIQCQTVLGKKAPTLEYFTVGDIFKRGRKAIAARNAPPEDKQADLFAKASAAFGMIGAINRKRGE